MKKEIRNYIEKLDPKKLGIKRKVRVASVSKLGMGSSNLNYLILANNKKFVFRLNMQPDKKNKMIKEYNALKILSKINISPKPFVLDLSKKFFDTDLIILEYLEGITSNKTKPYHSDLFIRRLSILVAKMHNTKITKEFKKLRIQITTKGYEEYFKFTKNMHKNYIMDHLKNKVLRNLIETTNDHLKSKSTGLDFKPNIVLTQGDICEQNVIVNKGKISLIDFESTELADSAADIAHIFCTFGEPFTARQKKIFLTKYSQVSNRKDPTLDQRIEVWLPISFFEIFLWSIRHVLRSLNKDIHKKFLEENNVKDDIVYAHNFFKTCIRHGIISKKYSKTNIKKILSEE